MKIESEDMLTVTEASNRGVSYLVKAASEGRRVVVTRNSKPAALVVDVETMERLQHLEEAEEDLRLLGVAWARTLVDSGKRYSLEEVAERFGVDLDDDGGEDE